MFTTIKNKRNIQGKNFWLTLSATTFLSGCSFNYSFSLGGLDLEKLENTIQKDLQAQINLPINSVECPEEREKKEGDQFNCIARGDKNSEFSINVIQTDNEGNVDWNLVNATNVINIDIVEAQIQEGIKQQIDINAVINCAEQELMAADAGTTFTFQGESEQGEIINIAVEVEDDQGGYRWYTD